MGSVQVQITLELYVMVQFELGSKAKISDQVRFERLRIGQVKFTFGLTIKFEVSPTLLKTIV